MKVDRVDGKTDTITASRWKQLRSSAYQRGCMGASLSPTYIFEQEAYNQGESDTCRSMENK